MQWIRNIKASLTPLFKNKAVLIVLGFFVWVAACDEDSVIDYFHLRSKVQALEAEKAELEQSIEQNRRKMEELKNSRETLEKFAREEYFMKRDAEVIFILK